MKRFLGKLSIKTKITLIALLPLCAYMATAAAQLVSDFDSLQSARAVVSLSHYNGRISLLVHELQKERGSSSGFLASKGQKFSDILEQQRKTTDGMATEYMHALAILAKLPAGKSLEERTSKIGKLLTEQPAIRQKVGGQQIEAKDAIAYYTNLIAALLDAVAASSHFSDDPAVTSQMFAYSSFLQGKERAGIERATLSAVFSRGSFTTDTYRRFIQLLAAQDSFFGGFRAEATNDAITLYDATVRGQSIEEVERMRQIALHVGLDESKQFGVDPEVWFKTITEKIDLLKKVDDGLSEKIIATASSKAESLQRELVAMMTAFVVVLAVSIFLVSTIAFSLIRGISTANHVALDLAEGEGDLTKRMSFTAKDEIGVLGRSIDKLLTTLGSMIKQIKSNGDSLNQSGQELASLAEQMNGATTNIQTRANGVAASAEEMNINMSSVAAAVEEAAVNISTVAESTGSIADAGKNIAGSTKNARTRTGEAVQRTRSSYELISALGDAAKDIGRMTETINEISEQTNLLALNATIEAARAGEAGRGFAVVANEIKELAKQTAVATVEITERISGIQESSRKSVDEMQAILGVINEVDGIVDGIASAVEHQTISTEEIARNIEQASTGIQEVAHNISQISTASGEVAKDIAEVSQSSKELTKSSDLVRKSASSLNVLTASMKQVTDRFKV